MEGLMAMKLLEKGMDAVMYLGLPLVQVYHMVCGSIFLNTAAEDAQGLERLANLALVPAQYLLAGKEAKKDPQSHQYGFKPQFGYKEHFLFKTATSMVALPLSLGVGCTLKALAYLSPTTQKRHALLASAIDSKEIATNDHFYLSVGIDLRDPKTLPFIAPPAYAVPSGETRFAKEKVAMGEIIAILKENKIPFWIDCGSCLGAYRYGAMIPWDWDIDIAILQPDFENVKHALNALDKEKYDVQDWSGRNKPGSYLKVYVKGTPTLIDLYHFEIDEKKGVLRSICSNEENPFLPESWKIRERRYTVETPIDHVFPLKRAVFEGMEVLVPGKTKEYLQARYGENIGPVKIYNPDTDTWEKDLSHPYWQLPHAR
jgi:hypothetical protein